MNCRDTESLILAERDGVLTSGQHASLAQHLATCPACRQLRAGLTEATLFMKTEAANVPVPDAGRAWRELQSGLPGTKPRPAKKLPLAPVIWFGAPLAAAAALVFAFLSTQTPAPRAQSQPETARADFVEAGNFNASTMVYVDKDSGWLVVWATDGDTKSSG